MRKTIISPCVEQLNNKPDFLDLDSLAQVEITSEHPDHPIEAALADGHEPGWRAATGGEQMIRFIFDQPVSINRILLVFEELEQARTQEFGLCWLRHGDRFYRQILRQQFNFSPPHTTQQVENYEVDLKHIKILKLSVIADLNDSSVKASLKKLRLS